MEELTLLIDIFGWIGVGLYVVAYYLVSVGKVSGRSRRYQFMNLIGAFGVAANAFVHGAYPSAIVNVIWFGIAFAILTGVLRGDTPSDPGHPDYARGKRLHRVFRPVGILLGVLALAAGMLLLLPRPPQPLQPIRIYTGDWAPYVGRDLPDAGPLGSLVKQIFRRAGYDPVVEFTDWPGALDATAEGAALAAFPFIRSDDRAQDLVFSEPLLEFRYVLFYRTDGSLRKDALESWSRGELHDPGWRLGVAKGYELWMSLSKEAGDPRTYDTSAEGFEALAAGAIDLFAESELVGRHLLLDPDLQADAAAIEAADVKAGALASSLETLHIIAPRNRRGEKLVAELDRAIAALKSEGLLAEVQQLLDDGEALTPPRARVAMRDVTSAQDADGHAYRLAAGVQAVVLQWPKAFREREADAKQPPTLPDEDRRPLCQIKVASGPLRGRILRVAPEAFELLPPENNP